MWELPKELYFTPYTILHFLRVSENMKNQQFNKAGAHSQRYSTRFGWYGLSVNAKSIMLTNAHYRMWVL